MEDEGHTGILTSRLRGYLGYTDVLLGDNEIMPSYTRSQMESSDDSSGRPHTRIQ